MILNADDYRRRAQALEKLARDTRDPVVRKSLCSVAANWRALAEQAAGEACHPLRRATTSAGQAPPARA
jgi:hypothetical protein